VIIAREIIMSALREWMALKGQREAVAVAFSGKLKTTVQMIAIILLLLATPHYLEWLWQLGLILLYLAAVLSVYSMLQYLKSAWPTLRKGV
jgi:CDP-diacylglycerol--glycerol-3-phosphate 3-phosphatidyltransferase